MDYNQIQNEYPFFCSALMCASIILILTICTNILELPLFRVVQFGQLRFAIGVNNPNDVNRCFAIISAHCNLGSFSRSSISR